MTRIDRRASAALDVLGAVLLAACVGAPVALWWVGILPI